MVDLQEEESEKSEIFKEGISLELGDLIEIVSPTNPELNEQTFYIAYIDETQIEIINVANYEWNLLRIEEDGSLSDESITQILLLDRSEVKGYARQNKLDMGVWVDIHFNGEIPIVVTCIVSNIEEDSVEFTSYPENEVFYIDFEYKGLPKEIPIEKIIIRDPPASALFQPADIREVPLEDGTEDASITWTESGESVIEIPDGTVPDENIRDVLKKIYFDANELFGEDLGVIFQKVEVKEEHNAFYVTSDEKFNDFIDELLIHVPPHKRKGMILNKVHQLVERFKELRQLYSKYNENGVIIGKKTVDYNHKQLVERILHLDAHLKWILPVVNMRKKLYLKKEDYENRAILDVYSDKSDLYSMNEILNMEDFETEYSNNVYTGENNKYIQYYSKITDPMTPFNKPIETNQFLEFEKAVHSDLEAIVSNLNEYKIDCIENQNIQSVKYYIQKYNLGMNHVKSIEMKNGRRVYWKEPLMENDKLTLQHLVMMPLPVVQYSQIHLPSTNILAKTEMSQTPLYLHKIFNERYKIPTYMVDNLETELDYEKMEEEKLFRFLEKPTAFLWNEDLVETRDKYEKYLNVILPKVRTLVRILKKHIHDKISVVDVIRYLQPFLVYPEDLTYGQFKEIRFYIKEKITEIRAKLSSQSNEYSKLRKLASLSTQPTSVKQINPIQSIFSESKNMQDHFYKQYLQNTETEKTRDRKWTASEDLLKIWDADQGQLFANMMTFMLLSLVTPNKLLDSNEKAELETMNEEESKISVKNKDCIRRYLAKKYNSIAELQKDNHKEEVYYDKVYDDTKYDILKKYEKESKSMLPSKFRDYLAENLVQKHDCPREISDEMAETIIAGKKKVRDGEYAMVEMKPDLADPEWKRKKQNKELTEKEQEELEIEERTRTKRFYYKRMRDTWVRDESLTEESFYDNNTLFCNIDTSCLKNQKSNVCEPVEHATLRMKKEAAENAIKEFDKRFTVTMNELKTSIEKFIHSREKFLSKKREFNYKDLHKYDYIQFKLGEMYTKIDKIESPHAALWNMILSQEDYSKKQEDICRFISTFCRENLDGTSEDPHWYYCKDTNTKLVPISIGRLANAFVYEEDFSLFLDKICHEYGRLSEDGDSIVDKHSGYVLRKIDFIDQQEYEENTGFKITTNAILEKDTTTVVQELLKKTTTLQTVYDDPLTQTIYNVLFTLSRNADIPIDEIGEFVIGYCNQMMRNTEIVLTEKKYKKRIEKSDKEMPPYSVYYNQTLITIVGCIFLISIQTSIPSLKTRKTFPGCVQQFSGYPMEGVEDTSGLKYVACVMKGSSSSIEPWNAIRKLSVDVLTKRMKDVFDRYVLTDMQITNKYIKKREYLMLNPEMERMEEHGIQKWVHFLPPLVEYSIEKKTNGVGEGFHTETKELIEKGSDQQRFHFSVYKTNIIRNTFSMIENINKIISKKESILRTANQVPYLESACCNDIEKSIHPMSYFAEEEPTILLDLKRCQSSQIVLERIHELSLPPTFFHNDSTRFAYPKLPEAVVSSNIYKAYIHYCNFDTDLPIPEDLESICREKPEYYDANALIEDKINALTTHGKKYDKASLDALMSRIYKRNQLPSQSTSVYYPIQVFRDIIEHLHDSGSTLIPETLQNLLMNVLDQYDPRVFVYEEDTIKTPFQKAINRLRNYLSISNSELHKKVMAFIDKYGYLEKKEYVAVENFMLNLCKWKMDEDIKKTGKYHDDGMYRVTQFIENAIYLMTRSIPNRMIHGKNVEKAKIPKHWKLSEFHETSLQEIIQSTLEELRIFHNDETIRPFLIQVENWGAEIYRFIRHIPIHTSIVKEGMVFYSLFDKRTVYMLFQFVWYSTLYEFIETSDDEELLKVDIQTIRKEINEENKEKMDRNLEMDVEFDFLTETGKDLEMELQEVQIVTGMKSKLKEKVCAMLIAFIHLYEKEKKVVDIAYEDMLKRVNTTKQNEKKTITDFFKGLNKDERKIENMFKKYKLERWNVGNQKGVYQYDTDMFDKEHDLNVKRMLEDEMLAEVQNEELDENAFENIEGNMMDVDELSEMQTREQEEFYENEAMDMRGLRDGFMDGVYYEEDGMDDFGYDD